MPLLILLAFILVPLIEIAVFIQVGEAIGLWTTLGVIVLTALVGTALLRHQGLETLRRVHHSMERGEMPLAAVFDGACLLVAGALLLTPGFVTDALGGLLFVPPFRALLRKLLWRYLQARAEIHVRHGHGAGRRMDEAGELIEGDYEEVGDEDRKPPDDRRS